jgi:predicted phage terminase large subunit-like protein
MAFGTVVITSESELSGHVAINPDLGIPSLDSIRVERARRKLITFTTHTYPEYQAGWFHQDLGAKLDQFLEDVVAKKSPRVILVGPPRSGKTELVSRRFPAKALGKYPDLSIIATSYGSDLASTNNRDVQRIIDDTVYEEVYPETKLFSANVRTVARGTWLRNNDVFEIVGRKGVYRSAGVMAGITGRGAHILLIDDPIKNREEAESATYREKLWQEWTHTLYTRLAPGGGILIILTRWNEDDLAGRLIKAMKEGGEHWDVYVYPAIAEKDDEHRKIGEALHPERYNVEDLTRIKLAVGEYTFNSMYQGRPSAAEGNIFKRGFAQFIPRSMVKPTRTIISWDTAFGKTQASGAYSVSLGMQMFDRGIFIFDRKRDRYQYSALKEATYLQAAMCVDKYGLEALLIEDKASGQSLVQDAQQDTRLPVKPIEPEGDKIMRANVCTPYWESKRVFFPMDEDTGLPEPWVSDFLEYLYSFPNSAYKDDVDAFTQGIKYLTMGPGQGILSYYQDLLKKIEIERAIHRKEEDKHHKVEYINLLGATRART